MRLLDRLRAAWHRWRVKRQRWKLISAYATIGRVRYDLGPGFTSTMYAYNQLFSEGLLVIVDGEPVWLWPETDGVDVEAVSGGVESDG